MIGWNKFIKVNHIKCEIVNFPSIIEIGKIALFHNQFIGLIEYMIENIKHKGIDKISSLITKSEGYHLFSSWAE